MAEAVPLGELLHEEALFGLTAVRKVGVPRDAYSRLDFASPPYILSSLGVARPFTNKVEKGWKKCTGVSKNQMNYEYREQMVS